MIRLVKSLLLLSLALLVFNLYSCRKITSSAGVIFGGDTIAAVLPAPLGTVSDFGEILTPEEIRSLDSMIVHYERSRSSKISIVTVDDIYPFDSLAEYADRLHDGWKKDAERDNSVFIFHAVGLEQTYISVGSKLRKKLSDKEIKRIIHQTMEPEFDENARYKDLKKGLQKIIGKMGGR